MKTKFLLVLSFAVTLGTAQTAVKKNNENVNNEISADEPTQDKQLLQLDIPDYGITGNYHITGVVNHEQVRNASNITISYRVDDKAVVSEKIALTINRGAEFTSFNSPSTVFLPAGNHEIKAWVSEINGVTVTDPELVTTTVHIASKAATRHGLIEEFTSSTCGPCATENAKFDPLLLTYKPNTGGNYNIIKYQMDWPSPFNDPSYNVHGERRKMYYAPNSGIPFGIVNGKKTTFDTKTAIEGSATAPATVDINAYLAVSGNNLVCKAIITPYVTSTVTVHQALVQEYYTYNGTSGQKKYYWVMRKMNPDGDGQKNVSIKDGVAFDVQFNHTAVLVSQPAQGSFDFWSINTLKYQYVVYLQDEATKSVLNSASGLTTTVGVVDIKKDAQMAVYPNPSEGFAIIGIKIQNETNISLHVYDLAGKLVYKNESPVAGVGQNEMTINTSGFTPGVYTVVVSTSEGILRDKLVVN